MLPFEPFKFNAFTSLKHLAFQSECRCLSVFVLLPRAEHRSHSSKCPFINLKKEVEALSVEEFLKLEKERDKYINVRFINY